MKKIVYFFIIALSASYAMARSSQYQYQLLDLDFVAPSVPSTSSITNAETGLIVYDNSNAGFYGKDATGAWVNLNASTLASHVAFVSDVKSSGTNGGTCTSGAWRTR